MQYASPTKKNTNDLPIRNSSFFDYRSQFRTSNNFKTKKEPITDKSGLKNNDLSPYMTRINNINPIYSSMINDRHSKNS